MIKKFKDLSAGNVLYGIYTSPKCIELYEGRIFTKSGTQPFNTISFRVFWRRIDRTQKVESKSPVDLVVPADNSEYFMNDSAYFVNAAEFKNYLQDLEERLPQLLLQITEVSTKLAYENPTLEEKVQEENEVVCAI